MLLHALPTEVLRYLLVVWCCADDLEALASVCRDIQQLTHDRLSNVTILHHKPFRVPKGSLAKLETLRLHNFNLHSTIKADHDVIRPLATRPTESLVNRRDHVAVTNDLLHLGVHH